MTTTLDQSFTARQLPWLKIGTVIDDPSVDAAEAARLGGIDFDVELVPAGYWSAYQRALDDTGEPLFEEGDDGYALYVDDEGNHVTYEGEWLEEPTRRAVRRQDTKEWFSYASTDYRVVQFREAFEFMDAINPLYVAAGALSHGRQGFIIAQLPEHLAVEANVNGELDPHDTYVVLQTSHDLSKSIKVSVMMLRNKCMNMLTLPSFAADAPQHWTIPHIGDPHAKLKQAQQTLTRVDRYAELFENLVTRFASVRIADDDLRHIARRVLPSRLKTRDQQVEAIVDRFQHAETVGYHGTGWGAINAVSDYLQWGRATAVRTDQSIFTSPLEGDTAKYVNNTAQLVMARA